VRWKTIFHASTLHSSPVMFETICVMNV
jgi:hypothetical protein